MQHGKPLGNASSPHRRFPDLFGLALNLALIPLLYLDNFIQLTDPVMHIEDGSAKRATEASNLSPAVTTHDGAQEDKKFDINLNQIQSVREGGLVLERSHLKSTRFGIFSCLAIQFATTAPPLAISLYSGLITGAGGSPFFFWGFIVAFIGQLFMAMSLAEISSSYPQTTGKRLRWGFIHTSSVTETDCLSQRKRTGSPPLPPRSTLDFSVTSPELCLSSVGSMRLPPRSFTPESGSP